MNIGSREVFSQVKMQQCSAKDYVQTGLIALWDAIENIGFEQHNSDATVWKDLAGNYDLTVNSKIAHFTDDCLVVHTLPTSSGFTNAPAYHPSLTLPANEDLEFEVVYSMNRDYDDNFSCQIVLGGGASNVDTTRARNVVLVQYLTQYGRHFTGSSTSAKMLPYNNASTTLTAGRHSYSSGATRTRPLFDGEEVSGNIAFDAFPLTVSNMKLTVGGVKYSDVCNTLPIGCGVCCVRVYSRHLTLEERLNNFSIDKVRFRI